MKALLTATQQLVLDFIIEYQSMNQYPPTRAEIQAYFGWGNRNSAETHVRALERKGALFCRPNVARGITVLEEAR